MLRYGRSSPGPSPGMEFLRMSRWRSAQKRRCGSRCYIQRGHGTVINQDGWYTFYVANRYTFKCRLTQTTSIRNEALKPIRMNRSSSVEWSGSASRRACSSVKTVDASSKETPCFLLFSASFAGSHSIFGCFIITLYVQWHYRAIVFSPVFNAQLDIME